VLPSGQTLNLGLLATFTLKAVPFFMYAWFSALLPFFKCILEVVFCEGVRHHLRFSLDHLSCVKMAAFQFYLELGKQRKAAGSQVRPVGWVEDDSYVVFGKKFPDERGSVRWCVMMQQSVLL
jgi:hypothetical protein